MRICVFTTVHPVDDVRVKSKFVDSWLADGHEVTWIGPQRSFFTAADDLDPRVAHRLVAQRPGRTGRLRSLGRLRRAVADLRGHDWIYSPDPDAALIALTSSRTPVLLDLHEEYHKGHLVQQVPPAARPALRAAVRLVIRGIVRRCALVTGVHHGILGAYGAPAERSLVTLNTPPAWFQGEGLGEAPGRRSPVPPRPLRVFHGKAQATNGTGVVLSALATLRQEGVAVRTVVFPGPGPLGTTPYDPTFTDTVHRLGIEPSLELVGGVPHREMPALMARADVGLISYDRELGVGSLPNRFFEYLALGVVPVVPSYATLMREILERLGVGLVADFEDPDDVARVLTWCAGNRDALARMSDTLTTAFRDEYAWEQVLAPLTHRMEAACT